MGAQGHSGSAGALFAGTDPGGTDTVPPAVLVGGAGKNGGCTQRHFPAAGQEHTGAAAARPCATSWKRRRSRYEAKGTVGAAGRGPGRYDRGSEHSPQGKQGAVAAAGTASGGRCGAADRYGGGGGEILWLERHTGYPDQGSGGKHRAAGGAGGRRGHHLYGDGDAGG